MSQPWYTWNNDQDVIRYDKYSDGNSSIEPLVSLSQSKERYKALKIMYKMTYNWEF